MTIRTTIAEAPDPAAFAPPDAPLEMPLQTLETSREGVARRMWRALAGAERAAAE